MAAIRYSAWNQDRLIPDVGLSQRHTARSTFTWKQLAVALLASAAVAGFVWRFGWTPMLLAGLGTVTTLYLLNFLFLSLVVARSAHSGVIEVTADELAAYPDSELPKYTI